MTDVTSQLNLPADPPADVQTVVPAATPAVVDSAPAAPAAPVATVPDPSTVVADVPGVGDVDLVTSTKAAPPKVVKAADGTYHLVLTWTKSTKAHVGTTIAAVTGLGELATTYVLPATSEYTHWAQVALGVVGLVGTWLGIYLPTNTAKSTD